MNKKYLARGLAVLLVLSLLPGCAAADSGETTSQRTEATTAQSTVVPENTTVPEETTVGADAVKFPLTFLSMNLNQSAAENNYLMAYPNEDGTVYVEYMGQVKKIATNMDESVLASITAALAQTKLAELNGQSVYEDGQAVGSVYAEFSDGSILSADFTGTVPQEYIDAYMAVDACFQTILADVEVYVPQPVMMGEVNHEVQTEMEQILGASGIVELDMLQISDVPSDDVFTFVMGLSSSENIVSGTSCTAMMMTTPYSFVIAEVEDENSIAAVRKDFINNLDWQKFVCVIPTDALVAQKGNLVLCLMGADAMFRQTADAIADCGWENIEEIPNPDM